MSNNTLLIRLDEQPFDASLLASIITEENGFRDVQLNRPDGTPIEASFVDGEDWTIVSLHENCQTISLSSTSDATLHAVLILSQHLNLPLRLFDTSHSFDLPSLKGLNTIDQLQSAIDRSHT